MFYNQTQILKYKKSSKLWIILSSIIGIVDVALIISSIFIITDENVIFFKAFLSIFLSISFCLIFFGIRFEIISNHRKISNIEKICNSEEKIYSCEVREIGQVFTLNNDIKVYPVTINLDGAEYVLYFDFDLDIRALKIGCINYLKVRNNFICEVGE